MSGPNPLRVAYKTLRALRVRRPRTFGSSTVDHHLLERPLRDLAGGGLGAIDRQALQAYLDHIETVDPQMLTRDEALAFWLNAYNAHAIDLACDALDQGAASVLDLRGSFDRPIITLGGETLSLMDIEHGKIRRFHDPRIHGSLVCGSLSCPTLRPVPFMGASLDADLDEQMHTFLRRGGVRTDGEAVQLSRVFLWYGADFVRPRRMPLPFPASKRAVAAALDPWMPPDARAVIEGGGSIAYQPYDWGLACTVA